MFSIQRQRQLFLRRVTTNRGRHRRPIERRLSQWENREVVQLAGGWAGGVLPRWYYAQSLAARVVALQKAKVGRREVKPVRPIGVGSAVHRLVGSAVVAHAMGVFRRLLCPIQVAVGVKGAAK